MNDIKHSIKTIRELHKQLEHTVFYDQPIKSSKWKILVFLIDGISGVTICSFNNEEEAARGVQTIHEQIKLFPLHIIKDFLPNINRCMQEIHHAIPIPVKE